MSWRSPRDISTADLHEPWSRDFRVWRRLNLVPRVFSFSNMAAAAAILENEMTLGTRLGVVCSNSSREIERSLLNPCKMFYSSDFSPTTSECESEMSLVNELVEFEPCNNSVKPLATGEETSRTSSRIQREFVLKRLSKSAVSAPILSRAPS